MAKFRINYRKNNSVYYAQIKEHWWTSWRNLLWYDYTKKRVVVEYDHPWYVAVGTFSLSEAKKLIRTYIMTSENINVVYINYNCTT